MSQSRVTGREEFRPPSDRELGLLTTLLTATFPGHQELFDQLSGAEVRRIDANGSLSLRPLNGPPAPVMRRIPVEAELEDGDGVTIHLLLHVLKGYLNELEVYRDDSAPVQVALQSESLRILIL